MKWPLVKLGRSMAEQRVVIADAGPLIAFSRVGALHWLPSLFGEVWITDTVRQEVCNAGVFPGQDLILAALAAGNLRSVAVDMALNMPNWQPRFAGIDLGEASAIALAESIMATADTRALLIVDDRLGRLEAQARGLPIIGTAAVVGLAKTRGLIPCADDVLRAMQANGYFLGNAVVRAILDRVGE
jgi:predicted nucleic acid-binding protein